MSAIASPPRLTPDSAPAMKDPGPGTRRSSEEWEGNTLRAGRSRGTPLSIPAASGGPGPRSPVGPVGRRDLRVRGTDPGIMGPFVRPGAPGRGDTVQESLAPTGRSR